MAEKIEDLNEKFRGALLDKYQKGQEEKARKRLVHLKENIPKFQFARGAAIESSLIIENIYNAILIKLKGQDEEEVLEDSFGRKTNKVILIIEEEIEESEWRNEIIQRMKEIKSLRNLYAHVPQDLENPEPRFSIKEKYYRTEFQKKFQGIPLKEMNKTMEKRTKDFPRELYIIMKKLIFKLGLDLNNLPPKE